MSPGVPRPRSRSAIFAAVLALTAGTALAGAASAGSLDLLGSSATPKISKTVYSLKDDAGKLVKSVNYTVNVKPQARAAAAGTDSYGNPIEDVSLQGLPSVPLAGAAGPLENGKNPLLDNEPGSSAKCPKPGNGHEYLIVWAGKMNAADLTGTDITDLVNGGAVNPEGLVSLGTTEFGETGSDMMATLDAEPGCATYGKVVNVATITGPDGIENEPHHMQYAWYPGQSVWSGGLFTSRLFTWDLSALPKVKLLKTDEPWSTPSGSIWDAFATTPDGDAYGTLMGGPLYAYGTTPGAVVKIAGANHPGKKPGDILGEWPSNAPDSLVNGLNTKGSAAGALAQDLAATATNVPNVVKATNCPDKYGSAATSGNTRAGCETGLDPASGLPRCTDIGSCANPHGIQVRADLKTMVTSDYAEPAEIIEDPVKPPAS
ncbi:MAG: hypothetical protein JWM40_1727, partial [Frankiales bacterium]|nr:hypothetical protein [Frankiales bacterium]